MQPSWLDGLLNLVALEAARADIRARRLAVEQDADALEVRVEAPLRGNHRVAPVVAEAGLLPADCADLGHRRRSVATAAPHPRRRAAGRRRRPSRAPCGPLRRPCPAGPGPVLRSRS